MGDPHQSGTEASLSKLKCLSHRLLHCIPKTLKSMAAQVQKLSLTKTASLKSSKTKLSMSRIVEQNAKEGYLELLRVNGKPLVIFRTQQLN
jgi:hypothetical protein